MFFVNEICGRDALEGYTNCESNPAPDNIGAFSVFIDVGDYHNEAFEPIIKGNLSLFCDFVSKNDLILALRDVRQQGDITTLDPIKPIELLPDNKDKFFRYFGSVNSPGISDKDFNEYPSG